MEHRKREREDEADPGWPAFSKDLAKPPLQIDLGKDRSWVRIYRNWLKLSEEDFEDLWKSHPDNYRKIVIHGREVALPRYQQAYGKSYTYSGAVSEAIEPTPLVSAIQERLNQEISEAGGKFNMCLCNWYEPKHYIGPHSDDTRQLIPDSPIASLSLGGTRIFKLTPKDSKQYKMALIEISDGDLVVMGGKCQETHRHEILKVPPNKQATTANRVNFTFRCFE